MKILHFNQYGTNIGGVENYIAEVSQALLAEGHETRLISFASEDPSRLMPNTTQVLESDIALTLSRIEQIITHFQPDLVYLHAVYESEVVRYLNHRVPSVTYVHGPYPVCPGNALFLHRSSRACERAIGPMCLVNAQIEHCCFGHNPVNHIRRLRQVRQRLAAIADSSVLVGSEFMHRQMTRNGILEHKVHVLPPFLVRVVPEYTAISDPETILFGGRITPEKGLRHLINALASMRSEWRLIIAGDGPDRSACEQLAQRLGVAERIQFLGWVGSDQMRTLYRRCAFVVVPSLWPEPYGRIGPEAFTYGRPAIGYAIGGIPDWLKDGKTGLLATPGNIGSLSKAIVRLLDGPDECTRMGLRAREYAEFTWDMRKHLNLLMAHFEKAIHAFYDESLEER